MSKSVVARTRLCAALTGVGLLALTGCSGGSSAASLVDAANVVASPSSAASASPSAVPTTEPTAAPVPTPTPVITVSEQWVEEAIGFASRRQDDPSLDRGVEALAVAGVAGVRATLMQVTLTDGVETGRVAVGEEVRRAPVDEVVAVGTKAPVVLPPPPAPVAPPAVVAPPVPIEAAVPAAGGCDPNYDGDCVPIDSDVDCAGGSGNGPSYVQGPVRVIGTDIYGLDGNDNDGLGCE